MNPKREMTSAPVPRHKLVAFRRVRVRAGRRRRLRFTLTSAMMSFVDRGGEQKLEPGRFRLTVGSGSPGERGRVLGAPKPQIAYFELISV